MVDVLVVEDDEAVRVALVETLRDAGHAVVEVGDGERAIEQIGARAFDLVLCDVRLPGVGGLTVLRRIKRESPRTAVVMMTTFADVRDVVSAVRDGAADYVTKPFDPGELVAAVVTPIAERVRYERSFEAARDQLAARFAGETLVGRSPAMFSVRRRIEAIARVDAGVLFTGETGTGKELVARTVHARSARRDRPFVVVDAGVSSPSVGALATDDDAGAWRALFRASEGGTVLVRHVDALDPRLQAGLVRAISELSASGARHTSPRVVATSLSTIDRLTSRDALRPELLALLGVALVEVPPLRARGGDREELVHHFLYKHAHGVRPPRLAIEAWRAICAYSFPGNVRELDLVIQRALVAAGGDVIGRAHLPDAVANAAS